MNYWIHSCQWNYGQDLCSLNQTIQTFKQSLLKWRTNKLIFLTKITPRWLFNRLYCPLSMNSETVNYNAQTYVGYSISTAVVISRCISYNFSKALHIKTLKQTELHTSESNTDTSKFKRGYVCEVKGAYGGNQVCYRIFPFQQARPRTNKLMLKMKSPWGLVPENPTFTYVFITSLTQVSKSCNFYIQTNVLDTLVPI